MTLRDGLRWLPIVVGLCACSSSSSETPNPTEVDPGKPAAEVGTKCYLELVEDASGAKLSFDDCTVSAASNERTSHIYFDFRRLPQGAQRLYISLVLGMTPLGPGMHASARTGAVEATLQDGRRFSAGDVKKEGSLHFVVTEAPALEGKDIFFVTGSFEATLAEDQNVSSTIRLTTWINKPPSIH